MFLLDSKVWRGTACVASFIVSILSSSIHIALKWQSLKITNGTEVVSQDRFSILLTAIELECWKFSYPTNVHSSSACTALFNYGYILHLIYCNVMYCTGPSQLIAFKFSNDLLGSWANFSRVPVSGLSHSRQSHATCCLRVLKRASVTRWIPTKMKVSFTTSFILHYILPLLVIILLWVFKIAALWTLKRGKYFFVIIAYNLTVLFKTL